MTEIILEQKHIEFAERVGRFRQDNADRQKLRGKNGGPTTGDLALQRHIEGARCECAAYLYFKPVFWNAWTTATNEPDLDGFVDVKGTDRPDGRLIVQAGDPVQWAYVLALWHRHPIYTLGGWFWGTEAKLEKFWTDPKGNRPAYFVPQAALHPMTALYDIVRERQR